jgi:hypothetical protein
MLELRRHRSGGSQFRASQGKSLERPYLEKIHHKKKGWQSDLGCRPWVQTPVPQKKKENVKERKILKQPIYI